MTIEHASIALATGEMDAVPGSIRQLNFGGKSKIVIPPGAPALSDPVDLSVASMNDLVVSVYVPDGAALLPMGPPTMLLSDGDDVMTEKFPSTHRVSGRPLVSAVLVTPERPARVVVALGDSITDALRNAPAVPRGWVAVLAKRAADQASKNPLAVVSAGISGNRVIRPGMGQAAVARADRDVFSTPGIKYIILLEGINDIGISGNSMFGSEPDLDVGNLEEGYQQIVNRAHALGIKVFAGTLLPFRGAFYFTDEKEQKRLAVNTWIRTSNAFDGVIDFEATLRDPASPDRYKAEFDSGDHLHPSDAGYKAMGDSIDLKLFN